MHLTHDPDSPTADEIAFDAFLKVDIRAGMIREALPFPEAHKPAITCLPVSNTAHRTGRGWPDPFSRGATALPYGRGRVA